MHLSGQCLTTECPLTESFHLGKTFLKRIMEGIFITNLTKQTHTITLLLEEDYTDWSNASERAVTNTIYHPSTNCF